MINESELSPDIKVRNSTPVVQYVNNVFGDILQNNQVYKRWHMLPLVIHIRQKMRVPYTLNQTIRLVKLQKSYWRDKISMCKSCRVFKNTIK